MKQKVDWDGLWMSSIKQAEGSLAMFGDRLVEGLPEALPFEPHELAAADFDMDRALERIALVLENTVDRH